MKAEEGRSVACSGQVLLEACLWTLLLAAVVITGTRWFQAEYSAYRRLFEDSGNG